MRKTHKYPQGYKPKLEYHTTQLAVALVSDDLASMQKSLNSIQFFLDKETARLNTIELQNDQDNG